ncbi:MAG TPA: autotransporter-associated beta strand repeat-containing protein, partial [Pirellulales bacterium]
FLLSGTNNGINVAGSQTLTASGQFSGTGGFTLNGPANATGVMVLTGNNIYTGGTMIAGGTLQISSDANLGLAVSGNNVTLNAGTLGIIGGVTTANTLSSGVILNPNREFALMAGGGTIDVAAPSVAIIGGTIANAGAAQTLTVGGTVLPTGGNFNLTVDGTAVNGIAYSTSAATTAANIQAALNTALGANNAVVSVSSNSQYTITFEGAYAGQTIPLISANVTNLTGGTGTSISSTVTTPATTLSGGLFKTDLGTLVLQGTNTFNGGVTVSAGTLAVSSDVNLGAASNTLNLTGGTFQVLNGSTFSSSRNVALTGVNNISVLGSSTNATLSGPLTGSGGITKIDTGTLTLSGVNTYSGVTRINNGTLAVTGLASGNALGTGSVVLAGGTLQLNGGATNTSIKMGASSVTGGGTLALNTGAGALNVTVASMTRGGNGTLDVLVASTGGVPTGTLTSPPATANGIVSPWIVLQSGPSLASAAAANADFVGLTGGVLGVATYTSTNLNTSLATNVTQISGNTLVTGSANAYALNLEGSTITGGNVNVAGGTIGGTNAAGLILNGSTLNNSGLSFGASEGIIFTTGSSFINAPISGTNVTMFGTGTLTLGAANTYTGNTTINGGTVSISADNALGAATGSVTLGGGTLQYTNNVNTSRSFILNSAASTIDITAGNTVVSNGQISGSGGLVVTDGGTLLLTRSNTYSGGTTVTGGALLILFDNSALGNVSAGVTLDNGALRTSTFASPRNIVLANTAALPNGGGTIDVSDAQTLTLGGQISGAGALIKNDTGTLVINGSGNTYTGGTILNFGSLTVTNPNGLGGGNNVTPGNVTLNGGTLNLLNNGIGVGNTITNVIGQPGYVNNVNAASIVYGQTTGTPNGYNVVVTNNATINVNNNGANTGNTMQLGNLSIGNQTLTVTGANNYQLNFEGTITLSGTKATFSTTTSPTTTSGNLLLDGLITGSGNLTKTGTGLTVIGGGSNTYTGNTTVLQGELLSAATSGSSALGTGNVIVEPGASLVVSANGTLAGNASVQVLSSITSVGAIGIIGDFTPTVSASAMTSVWGNSLVLYNSMTSSIDMSQVGNGQAYLGAGTNPTTTVYNGILFQGLLTNGSDGTLRIGANSAGGVPPSLVFTAAGGLGGTSANTSNVIVGSPENNAFTTGQGTSVVAGTGTVVLADSNLYSGGTTINRGSTLTIETGGSGVTPLGSGTVEIFGTLQASGPFGSFIGSTPNTANNAFILRPGGSIVLNNNAAVGTNLNNRFGSATPLNLNGGTFSLLGGTVVSGTTATNTTDAIGTLTLGKGGTINVARSAAVSGNTAALTISNLAARPAGATLMITTSAANSLGASTNYDQVTVSAGLPGYSGTVHASTGPTGILAPYIVDATSNTYVTSAIGGGGTSGSLIDLAAGG